MIGQQAKKVKKKNTVKTIMIILFEQIINQFLCVSTGLNRSICAGSYSEFVVMRKKDVIINFLKKTLVT